VFTREMPGGMDADKPVTCRWSPGSRWHDGATSTHLSFCRHRSGDVILPRIQHDWGYRSYRYI